jgi:hypothetical protein
MIEVICAREIPEVQRRQGVIELCRQEFLLTDVTNAKAL